MPACSPWRDSGKGKPIFLRNARRRLFDLSAEGHPRVRGSTEVQVKIGAVTPNRLGGARMMKVEGHPAP